MRLPWLTFGVGFGVVALAKSRIPGALNVGAEALTYLRSTNNGKKAQSVAVFRRVLRNEVGAVRSSVATLASSGSFDFIHPKGVMDLLRRTRFVVGVRKAGPPLREG
jgi:hypothetical protein